MALAAHWPWQHWSSGPQGAMQLFKQRFGTIRGRSRKSPLAQPDLGYLCSRPEPGEL